MKNLLLIALTAFMIIGCSKDEESPVVQEQTEHNYPLGQIPDWTNTTNAANPTLYNMYNLLAQGNVVIIDFSAMWCTPCYATTPAVDSLFIEYGNGTNSVKVFEFLFQDPTSSDTDSLDLYNWETAFTPNLSVPGFYNCSSTYINYMNVYGSAIPLILVFLPNSSDPGNSTLVYNYSSGLGVTGSGTVYSDIKSILDLNGF